MNLFGALRGRLRLGSVGIVVVALILGGALLQTVGRPVHARSVGRVGHIVERAQTHESQSWIMKLFWHHPAGCPFYPGATVALQLHASATLATGDAFGKVIRWYEAQHRMKEELEAASGPEPIPGEVASYSFMIRHPEANYLLTIYKLQGDPQTYVNVADAD